MMAGHTQQLSGLFSLKGSNKASSLDLLACVNQSVSATAVPVQLAAIRRNTDFSSVLDAVTSDNEDANSSDSDEEVVSDPSDTPDDFLVNSLSARNGINFASSLPATPI